MKVPEEVRSALAGAPWLAAVEALLGPDYAPLYVRRAENGSRRRRGYTTWMILVTSGRGDAADATWKFRGEESRRRRSSARVLAADRSAFWRPPSTE